MAATVIKFPKPYRQPPDPYPPLPDALPWDDPRWLHLQLREVLAEAAALADVLAERERER